MLQHQVAIRLPVHRSYSEESTSPLSQDVHPEIRLVEKGEILWEFLQHETTWDEDSSGIKGKPGKPTLQALSVVSSVCPWEGSGRTEMSYWRDARRGRLGGRQ